MRKILVAGLALAALGAYSQQAAPLAIHSNHNPFASSNPIKRKKTKTKRRGLDGTIR